MRQRCATRSATATSTATSRRRPAGQLRTEDLAPPTADDPPGAGLAASALPIIPAGMLPAIAPVLMLRRAVWTRFAASIVFAASGWGTAGQLLPHGTNATLLRSTAFFDDAGATTAIVVLTCWVLAGAALIVVAAVGQRRTAAA